jgi:TonB family protein
MDITGFLGVVSVSLFGSFSTTAMPPAAIPQVAAVTSTQCSVREAPAKVKAMAVVTPEIVREVSQAGTGSIGETQLEVDLEQSGRPSAVRVLASSGNRYLDLAAVDGASIGAYSPEVRECERVAGVYRLFVDFVV